jgi:N-acyl-D-aspartate/D-glutamate deacylase
MDMHDCLIHGGLVVDGSGSEPFEADVAIRDGRIAAVGRNLGAARRRIDAGGALVTPGFVDIHCHYDGQVEWDPWLSPSPLHGVTSVVMSNCGVGFAPVRAADRDTLIQLMEGVEDIPYPVLADGLSWNWETLPEYLDQIDSTPHAIDFAVQLPHGPLRVYVMGARGANREVATPDDLAQMQRIVVEALEAGALGFSTSRTLLHKTSAGDFTPTLGAASAELEAIAEAMRQAGKGVIELVSDFAEPEGEFEMLRRLVQQSGRPLSFSLAQSPVAPEQYRRFLQWLEEAHADGLPIRAQVIGRPIGILLGLDATAHPFFANPAYLEIAGLPPAARAAEMRKPERRAAILGSLGREDPAVLNRYPPYIAHVCSNPGLLYRLGNPPRYLPDPQDVAAAVAERQSQTAFETVYDWLAADDGAELLYLPLTNFAHGTDAAIHELITHPLTLMGLSDGGAHYGMICDASAPTFLLQHWAQHPDPARRIDLASAIHWLTAKPAAAVGLNDRGLLKPGYRADINILDLEKLHLPAPHVVRDLPSGGKRLTQAAEGYRATLVRGEMILENGVATGALPGRLIRGAQPAPTAG